MRDLAGNEYDGWVMKMPEKWGGAAGDVEL